MSTSKYNIITEEKKVTVQNLLDREMPITEIAKICNLSRPSIYKIKNQIENQQTGRKKSYNEKKLKIQCMRAIKKIKKRHEKITAKKIMTNIPEDIKIRTLQRFLNGDSAFKLVSIPKRIYLKDFDKIRRVEHVKDWFKNRINFHNVIYSDEARFSLDGPEKFISWQMKNDNNCNSRIKRAIDGGSVMVYGLIGSDGFLLVKKIEGTMNAGRYINLLNEDIIPLLRARYQNGFIYQEDNASCHKALKVKNYFEENNVEVLNWPAKSPDMSPIENVWALMKNIVYDGPQPDNKEILWEKINQTVDTLNCEVPSRISALFDGLTNRYFKIIENHGALL